MGDLLDGNGAIATRIEHRGAIVLEERRKLSGIFSVRRIQDTWVSITYVANGLWGQSGTGNKCDRAFVEDAGQIRCAVRHGCVKKNKVIDGAVYFA